MGIHNATTNSLCGFLQREKEDQMQNSIVVPTMKVTSSWMRSWPALFWRWKGATNRVFSWGWGKIRHMYLLLNLVIMDRGYTDPTSMSINTLYTCTPRSFLISFSLTEFELRLSDILQVTAAPSCRRHRSPHNKQAVTDDKEWMSTKGHCAVTR